MFISFHIFRFIGFSDEVHLALVGLAKGLRFGETSSAVCHVDFAEALRIVNTAILLKILLAKHSIDRDLLVGLSTPRSLPCFGFESSGGVVVTGWLAETHKVDCSRHASLDGHQFSSAIPSVGNFFVSHVLGVSRRANIDNFVELNRLLADYNVWLAEGDLHLRRWDALLSGL